MARYKDYEDDTDLSLESCASDNLYNQYSTSLIESEYLESFYLVLTALHKDDIPDPTLRDDVLRRIENDIHDGIIVKPSKSIDDAV